MIKHFYSYHVEMESLIIEIESLDIEKHEKEHLKALAESHIHHAIVDLILSELNKEDRKLFVKYLNTKDHEKIWKFLNARINEAAKKIKNTAQLIKSELYKDIVSLKKGDK